MSKSNKRQQSSNFFSCLSWKHYLQNKKIKPPKARGTARNPKMNATCYIDAPSNNVNNS